ncbi:glycoside hydrolase family 36 protein [Phytohabitans rumicis]|uniref:Alpha-galactosidase n=1 Tax=Phytohabitans rumicis TaxID=1076125 RepID=A0A6V8L0U2_9ACTN|nr:glycoside hydrolase family 36 protein [Phytohabitans rumicis]GFJ88411.1 hypothetical protein Prum_020530 [Phytohabitans rumicis]
MRSAPGVAAVRITTEIVNEGSAPVELRAVTSLATSIGVPADRLDLYAGQSQWLGENRWTGRPLRDAGLVDLGLAFHGQDQRGRLVRHGHSSWSTGGDLPVGMLVDRDTGRGWGWQIEHNGPWTWEIGERRDGPYLALLGPCDEPHQWGLTLRPGERFETVPVALVLADGGLDGVAAELTAYRRVLRRSRGDAAPVVFNDFMNTLMGDPTTERLLPLIAAAAEVGADVFCVDAGWYDDSTHWWDAVGEWRPSTTRFPGGLGEVIDAIRNAGMVPGLWLEPEVVGVRSPLAGQLPAAAFLTRGGAPVVEHGRLHLDLRHPAARAHLDGVVDRLVADFGIGYVKLDYNITAGPGTDAGTPYPGHGLLESGRAYLSWLDGVLARHPDLLLENCASGAMRQDYALLSRLHLQSTSDQQEFLRYPPIAAAAFLSILPEQAGNWAYPQPEMSDEEIRFTLTTGMLGRLYLSGHLDRMTGSSARSSPRRYAPIATCSRRSTRPPRSGPPAYPAGPTRG